MVLNDSVFGDIITEWEDWDPTQKIARTTVITPTVRKQRDFTDTKRSFSSSTRGN